MTEHWLTCDIESKVVIQGYKIASNYTRENSIRGGALLLVKDEVDSEKIDTLNSLSVEGHIEIAAAKIPKLNLVVLSIYRPPGGDFDVFIAQMDSALDAIIEDKLYNRILIGGDFNVDLLKPSPERTKIIEFFESYGLQNIFTEPSRVTPFTSTCIDNIYTNINMYECVKRTFQPHLSDHMAQRLQIPCSAPEKEKFRYKPDINEENTYLFIDSLREVDWNIISHMDAEAAYQVFHETVVECFKSCFPLKRKKVSRVKRTKLVRSPDLERLKNQVDAARTIFLVRRDDVSKEVYKRLKEAYKNSVDDAVRSDYLEQIRISKQVSKTTWKVIKLNTDAPVGAEDGSSLAANEMNKFFSDVAGSVGPMGIGSGSKFMEYLKNVKLSDPSSMFLHETTPEEILKVVSKMKNKSSCDVYGCSVSLLKRIIYTVVDPLCHLVNLCFKQGIFPRPLKLARIVPVFKRGDKNDCSNYRPIAVLPAFSKVYESLLKSRIMSYIDAKCMLSPFQHGFRKNKSTTTAMVEVMEFLLGALDGKEDAEICCCDLSRAFDCIDREILLCKLEYYGLRGPVYDILKSYLSDRFQVVAWKGTESDQEENSMGVPQGSILGPMLFILYINDLPTNVQSGEKCIFADDATFLNRAAVREVLIELSGVSMSEAQKWFGANKLLLNIDKTQKLVVTTKSSNETEGPIKLLGFTLDSSLTAWKSHIDQMCKKLSSAIYSVRRIKYIVNEEAALITYHAYFHSVATYGILLWGSSSEAERIFLKQKRAMRALAGVRRGQSCRDLFRKYRVLTIPSCFILACICHVQEDLGRYTTHSSVHNYPTRGRDQLILPKHRLCRTQNTFNFIGVKAYNALPSDFKDEKPVIFKRRLKSFLLENVCYSVGEFLALF